ncbi:MAG: aspartate/glutamate racemase family protein [Phycisphaerae bacterium]|nr:aspartate/glutamate racemase family protein [Phycisphaerae bacterium]
MHAKRGRICLIVALLAPIARAQSDAGQSPVRRPIIDAILTDKSSHFYLDVRNYPLRDRTLPIGVFDSGTGGLTVMDAILTFDKHDNRSHSFTGTGDGKRDFEKECFVYLGDKANMPYGNYPKEDKTDLLKEHILKDAQFLLGKRYYPSGDAHACKSDKRPVKAIVIACNTATAYGKSDIESLLREAGLAIKVIGVIDAGVAGALETFGKDEDGSIGILATAGTVASGGYVRSVRAQQAARGYTGEIAVFQQAGVGLAGAIDGSPEYIDPGARVPRKEYRGPAETHPDCRINRALLSRYGFDWQGNRMRFEGPASDPRSVQLNSVENYISYHLVSLLEQMRKGAGAKKLKAIVLGCTHYPFYAAVFRSKLRQLHDLREDGRYVYRSLMQERIALIDPALNTAKALYVHLVETGLFNDGDSSNSEFYISVPNRENQGAKLDEAGNFTYEYKYGRDAGRVQEYVKRVPFSRKTLSADVLRRLSRKVPLVFELIRGFTRTSPKTASFDEDEKI